jgi:hypothetical protein
VDMRLRSGGERHFVASFPSYCGRKLRDKTLCDAMLRSRGKRTFCRLVSILLRLKLAL